MKDLKLLGLKVRDRITGFEGIVETVAYDLYGCVMAVVKVRVDKKKPGEVSEGKWFDVKRLALLGKKAVMPQPNFDAPPGGAQKPSFPSKPSR